MLVIRKHVNDDPETKKPQSMGAGAFTNKRGERNWINPLLCWRWSDVLGGTMYDRQAVKPVSLIHSINLVPRYILPRISQAFLFWFLFFLWRILWHFLHKVIPFDTVTLSSLFWEKPTIWWTSRTPPLIPQSWHV